MRQSIKDSSDLVSKRRKVPHTARTAWKAGWNRNLSHGFYEPLLPGKFSILTFRLFTSLIFSEHIFFSSSTGA